MKFHLELVAPDLHDSLVRKLDLMLLYFAIMGLSTGEVSVSGRMVG